MKPCSVNLCPIVIYSELNLIHEILSQVYVNRSIKRLSLSKFTLKDPPVIYIVDLIGRALISDDIIKPFLKFAALCPTIVLSSNLNQLDLVTVISAPFNYEDLVAAIDKLSVNSILRVGAEIFINERSLNLIKISATSLTEIKLTRTECSLLKCLFQAKQNGVPVTEQTLLKTVFGYNSSKVNTNTVKTHICRLRQKVGKELVQYGESGYFLMNQ